MRILPFLERAIAASLWTLAAGAVATIIGLIIGSYTTQSRAEGLEIGFFYGQLLAVVLSPLILWWRVYRTMWLRGPMRSHEVKGSSIEITSRLPTKREASSNRRRKAEVRIEKVTEEAEMPPSKGKPKVKVTLPSDPT